MREHPIAPVTEPTQYRAIGVVRGVYVPTDAEQLTRGIIRTAEGAELEAVVLVPGDRMLHFAFALNFFVKQNK